MPTLLLKSALAVLLAVLALPTLGQEVTASLTVSTVPDKATVTCDGILRDETPLTLAGLRAGVHLIAVEKAGFLPSRRSVALTAGQRSSLVIPLERLTGLVLLQSVPDGADIEIGGAHRGKTPLLITDLSPGQYRLKASAPGFLSRDVDFEVENRIPQKVTVTLASDSATLTIRSQPVGAAVKVNGLSKTVTPCTLDRLPAGDTEVVVSLPEYEDYRTRVKLQANEAQSLDITLKAFPSALSVISTPTAAKVFVDEALKGQTPVTLEGLSAGSHSLRVEMDGYDPETRAVDVKNAEKKVEEFKLVRNVGRLEIMVKPDGGLVTVDGVEKGTVMAGAEGTIGQLAMELPIGDHKVVLSLKGYGPVEKRVTIEKGQTVTIKEVLRRYFVADTRIKLITGEIVTGVLVEKLPNDDIKLETQLGIYKTIKASDVAITESLKPGEKKN